MFGDRGYNLRKFLTGNTFSVSLQSLQISVQENYLSLREELLMSHNPHKNSLCEKDERVSTCYVRIYTKREFH